MAGICKACGCMYFGEHYHSGSYPDRCDACDLRHEHRNTPQCTCSATALRRALDDWHASAVRVAKVTEAERAAIEHLTKLFDEAVAALNDAAATIDEANEIMAGEFILDEEDADVSSGVANRCRDIAERIAAAQKAGAT